MSKERKRIVVVLVAFALLVTVGFIMAQESTRGPAGRRGQQGGRTQFSPMGGLIVAQNKNPRWADPENVWAITTNPDLETLLLLKEGAGVSVTFMKQ